MLMLRILTRLSVYLLSLSESSLRQKIMEAWPQRRPMKLRLSGEREQAPPVELSERAVMALRDLRNSSGWQLVWGRLELLSEECSEYYQEADRGNFEYRKGYMDGHLRTKYLVVTLVSQGEIGDSEWLENQLEVLEAPLRSILLGEDRPDSREQEQAAKERLGRVMQAVEEKEPEPE